MILGYIESADILLFVKFVYLLFWMVTSTDMPVEKHQQPGSNNRVYLGVWVYF